MKLDRYGLLAAAIASLALVGAGCSMSTNSTAVVTPPAPAQTNEPAPSPAPDTNATLPGGPSGAMRLRGNILIISPQKPRTTLNVFIENDKPAFVVVSESDAAGGKVLAVSSLLEVSSGNQVLTLSRETKDGETLSLAAYVDDGNGTYGPEDKPLANYNGDPVTATSTIDANATEGPNPAL